MRPLGVRASILLGVLGWSIGGCGGPKAGSEMRSRTVRPGVAFEMLVDNPGMVVLDLRPFAAYTGPTGHLERAISAPVDELAALWPVLEQSGDETVLLYSANGGRAQIDAAIALTERGLRYVIQIEGGLEAWVADGFSVRVEDAPLSPRRPGGGQAGTQ